VFGAGEEEGRKGGEGAKRTQSRPADKQESSSHEHGKKVGRGTIRGFAMIRGFVTWVRRALEPFPFPTSHVLPALLLPRNMRSHRRHAKNHARH